MTDTQLITLQHDQARSLAIEAVQLAPDGYIVEIRPTKRSDSQNAKLHATIGDIARQLQPDGKRYEPETWFRHLKREFFGPEYVELPDGTVIEKEPRSRWRNRKHFGEFIEFVTAFAVENGVHLTAPHHIVDWYEARP